MILILTDSRRDAEIIAAAVSGDTRVVHDVSAYWARAPEAKCLIVGYRRPLEPGKLELFEEIERRMPWMPRILVTPPDPEVGCRLSHVRVTAIVSFEDISELQAEVDRARHSLPLFRVAKEIERSLLPRSLRFSLTRGCRRAADKPLRNVTALAAATSTTTWTLSRSFRGAVGSGATIKQFVSALVILRAHQLRASGRDWDAVGRHVGFPRQTLHRKSMRWPGCTLKQLERMPHASLMARFNSELVRPLLDASAE